MASQSSPILSILIAVSSRIDLLADCLAALRRNMPADLPHETIVVLNEIEAGPASDLTSRYPDVRFLRSPVNLGMAGSANRARRAASGRFLVSLHDDATIEPGWAEALLEAAERHPRAGAVGSKVLFPDGRLQSAGAILWQSGATTPPWAGPAPDAAELTAARPVDYCGTCALLIRAEAFDAVGGFDEAFYPAYFVDVDLGLAMRSQGYYVLCEPRSVVRHQRHASSGKTLRAVAISRNRASLLRKWGSAMASHGPHPMPGDARAVTAALLRAARFAQDCEVGLAIPVAPDAQGTSAATLGGGGEIERHYHLSQELQRAIVAHLEGVIAARDDALARYQRSGMVRMPCALRRRWEAFLTVIGRMLGSVR